MASSSRGARAIRPNFMIIGAMKAGTTSLYQYLREHPQIFMSQRKEVDFFSLERNWRRGWSWYQEQFAQADPEAVAIGEASTTYTKYPEFGGVAARIAHHMPDARLIYVIRHPIERIRSHYAHHLAMGLENEPAEKALLSTPCYVNWSRYAMQADQYLSLFPRERLLIITSESLRDARWPTVARVLEFLGVDADWRPPSLNKQFYRTEERHSYPTLLQGLRRVPVVGKWVNYVPRGIKRTVSRPLNAERHFGTGEIPEHLTRQLTELLRNDVGRLRSYMDEDFDGWGIA